MPKKTKRADVSVELVVRRGALRRFEKLKQKAANLPVEVLWDRRQGERRMASDKSSPNHRKTDRRQKPPFTWEASDFVVVPRTPQRKRK
jgi:hypothetical protein